MRIIKEKTLFFYSKFGHYRAAEKSLKAWVYEVKYSNWASSHELKEHFRNASILGNKRVVFNINGNDFRLIVDIEFKLQLVFIVWFGTHAEYNVIDANKIKYEGQNNKK